MNLKQVMTYEEMELHMKKHTFILPSRVSVGKYAKRSGYKVYKPMKDGKILHLYVNEKILNK